MADPGLELNIDTSELQELIKQFPEYQDIVLNKMEAATLSSLFMFQGLIQGNTPVGVTGNLRQSFMVVSPVTRGRNITGRVVSGSVYGLPIERGRTPGSRMPPVDAIELWVRRVLGVTENSRGVAFAIAKKIGKRGFRDEIRDGYRMVEKAFDDGRPVAIGIFNEGISRSVRAIEREIDRID